MYSYTYDKRTGGILLNSSPTGFSKEPRPVYAPELDLLGFDKYWKYDKQTDAPYMWAEANRYFYYGRLVAQLRGGNVYQAPEIVIPNDEGGNPILPEPKNSKLNSVNIAGMVDANREILGWLEETTAKKILAVYEKYKDKLDIFHVAFSGGKDSCVLLDLVKSVLPHDSFVVVFGDTGMEFPDTYIAIEQTRNLCEQEKIPFYAAKSHLEPQQSWELFGPPSSVLRWCCSVHKSTPQTLKLREVTGKDNYTGLDFVGVRAHESIARSEYEYENYGKKQKGQYSHNPILEWTSAEVWLYIYSRDVIINEAYKKGNGRAGCLFCPMSGGACDYVRRQTYMTEIDRYIDKIKRSYDIDKRKKSSVDSYVLNGGWNARKNGRELKDNELRCIERFNDGYLYIDVKNPSSDWREWIKTINETKVQYSVSNTKCGFTVRVSESLLKENPLLGRLFRQVYRKATYCIGCRVCETNCKNGCISFENNKVKITDCVHCYECHNVDSGCLLFHSLRHPQGGGKSMKSLNSFADHAPKPEWLRSYFEFKEDFFANHTLGPMMYDMFRRFLKDAGLQEKNHFTPFAELISNIGYDSDTAMGLVVVTLVCENPQIEWYVNNIDVGRNYNKKIVEDMLIALDVKTKDAKSIIKAFKRLTETPLGTKLNFGYVDGDNMARTTCSVSDHRVILYALYKFAEKCNDYKEFTLHELLSDNIDRDGVSPTRIFGLGREDMIPILLGLSANFSDFINATFTNDLDKISLKDDKTSEDVLNLFRKGN
ncbi:hypothetical protein AGMMS50276_16430 [Synergistales bacterium]|nr:hypothetical protein AGMMS50276_16430 [Synergistales bacterium]